MINLEQLKEIREDVQTLAKLINDEEVQSGLNAYSAEAVRCVAEQDYEQLEAMLLWMDLVYSERAGLVEALIQSVQALISKE